MNPSQNRVLVTLIAAILIPRLEQHFGLKLTADDIADLVALVVVGAHGVATFFVRYFPPKGPMAPKGPSSPEKPS